MPQFDHHLLRCTWLEIVDKYHVVKIAIYHLLGRSLGTNNY